MIDPARIPRDASLFRLGSTAIDFILAFFICMVSPFIGGLIWWICRFYFHIRTGTSPGKKLFKLRLVDIQNFQQPNFVKCFLHDILGFTVYVGFAFSIGGYKNPIFDFFVNLSLILFGMVSLSSLISLGLDKKLGRTVYDFWSQTAIVREKDSDMFYPINQD
jgi:hypothetical protein